MRTFYDVLLVLVTTLIMMRSLKIISNYKSKSLSDWTILLLYVFQSLPVLLDLVIGVPEYKEWYAGIRYAMASDKTCIIYDIYVIVINIFLMLVSVRSQRKFYYEYDSEFMKSLDGIPNFLLYAMILLPAFHVLISGKISSFLTYASFDGRGLDSDFTTLNSSFIIIAIVALIIWYFREKSSILRLLALLSFSFLIIWISGKRYTVVTILFSFLYVNTLEYRKSKRKVNLRILFIIMGAAVLLYSAYYITSVKVTADSNFNSVYAALRIDFGRDDVVKFTIWEEYINNKHILDYPLQSVISTLFMIVPRSLFPGKGYPHYRYLTAALYNTDVLSIPAGMTPSILEMMISNFRLFGMPLCILFLCWYCKKADKSKSNLQHYCYAMVLEGMLTQSMDAMIILFYMVIFFMMTSKVRFITGKMKFKAKNVKFKLGGEVKFIIGNENDRKE